MMTTSSVTTTGSEDPHAAKPNTTTRASEMVVSSFRKVCSVRRGARGGARDACCMLL